MNQDGQLVGPNVIGELAISGLCLADGYLNRDELTRQRFISNRFSNDEDYQQLYMTGDLVFLNEDWQLIFYGRKDHQIKLNGQRIELDGIEFLLCQHMHVEQAAVVVQHIDGIAQMVAFIVGDDCYEADIRSHMVMHVAASHCPLYYVFVASLPITATGKLDRKMLIAHTVIPVLQAVNKPQTETEIALFNIWVELLNVEQIDCKKSLFEYGVNSLVLIRALSQIITHLGVQLKIADFYKYTSISRLANYIVDKQVNTKRQVLVEVF